MDSRQRNAIVYGVIVSWMVFPIFCVLIVMAASVLSGCAVDEGSPAPCIVFGVDIGRTLYILRAMGWLGIVTLPSGGVALALYTVFVMLEARNARRQRPLPPREKSDRDDGPPNLRP
jgi:hypothetical protein